MHQLIESMWHIQCTYYTHRACATGPVPQSRVYDLPYMQSTFVLTLVYLQVLGS